MNDCIIGIGSNIQAESNIRKALELLSGKFQIIAVSDMVKTLPIGIQEQADFINGAVHITTELELPQLQEYLKKTESQLGRDRSLPKFGSRTIDLDIVVWNQQVVDDDYYSRDFLQTACHQLGFSPVKNTQKQSK